LFENVHETIELDIKDGNSRLVIYICVSVLGTYVECARVQQANEVVV